MGLLDNIAELTRHQNDAYAEGLRAKGQIWGGTIRDLGQLPALVQQQMQQQRRDKQRDVQVAQEAEINRVKLDEVRRHQQGQQVLASALSELGDDPQAVSQAVAKAGFPEIGQAYLKQSTDNAESLSKLATLRREQKQHELETVGDIAFGAQSMEDFTAGVALMKAAGLLNDETVKPLKAAQSEADWSKVREQYLQWSPKYKALDKDVNVPPGGTIYNPAKGGVQFTAPNPTQEETARHNQAMEATAQTSADRMGGQADETARHNQAMEKAAMIRANKTGSGGGAASSALDPYGIEYAATEYRVTGKMPPLGMGNGAARAAIINNAAKQARELGQSPAAAITKRYTVSADAGALKQIEKMASSAEAFEAKAIAQTAIISELSAKVPRTKFPIINAAIQAGRTNISGDENATKLANAVTTFAAEYAKIMEGSTGSAAGSSDSARRAADRLINASMSNKTMTGVLDLMKREMALTIQGYGVARDHITNRIGGVSQPQGAATVWIIKDGKLVKQ